jgi:hypothetical protein
MHILEVHNVSRSLLIESDRQTTNTNTANHSLHLVDPEVSHLHLFVFIFSTFLSVFITVFFGDILMVYF